MQEKQIIHTKSSYRIFLGSVQTSVVGLSHRFHLPSDAGSQLKALSVFLGKCRENMHGTTETWTRTPSQPVYVVLRKGAV